MEFEQAQTLILEQTSFVGTQRIPLEKSYGRILAKDMIATQNVPPFKRSPYDGYGLLAEDTRCATKSTPAILKIVTEIKAGDYWEEKLLEGQAVKILTGAPVPEGVSAIVPYEITNYSQTEVHIFEEHFDNENIVPCGEDVKEGERIACAGTAIEGPEWGLLASQGIKEVEVFCIPRIGIISIGNELLESTQGQEKGKIYNTNRFTLEAACKEMGFHVEYLQTVEDNVEKIAEVLKEAVLKFDFVLTTGGVSVGDYDMTKAGLDAIGAKRIIDGILIKPGSSCACAIKDQKIILCLSGNPAAAMTTFYLLGVPALRQLAGYKKVHLDQIQVSLEKDYPKKSPKTRILRGKLDLRSGIVKLCLLGEQGNGVISSLKGCDVLGVVPAGSGALEKDTILNAYRI